MAGGQSITSGQGTATPSRTVPVAGSAVSSATGALSADLGPTIQALTGSASTSAQGTAAAGAIMSLRSRKVGGGAASRALVGSSIASESESLSATRLSALIGTNASLLPGAFGKNRSHTPTGIASTVSSGTLSGAGDPSWPITVPTITFTQGTASTHDLTQYTSNFNSALYTIDVASGSPALPTGVTLAQTGILSYNGAGPSSSTAGYVFEIRNKNSSIQLSGSLLSLSQGVVSSNPSQAADWANRISGPSVVWYHNFDAAAEVNQFRWTGAFGSGNDPSGLGAGANFITRVASGGADGGGFLRATYPAGGVNGGNSHWWRPYNAFTGATNGRGTNDPGASGTITPVAWPATSGSSTTSSWSANASNPGWYMHANHQAANPGKFQGSDFWLQVRVRRTGRPGAPPDSGSFTHITGKCVWFNTTTFSNPAQELVTAGQSVGNGDQVGVYERHNAYIAQSSANTFTFIGDQTPPATVVTTNISINWRYSGGWDTLLYHLTPGPNGGTSDPNRTRVEVWAQHDPALFPAEAGQYVKIWDVYWGGVFDTSPNSQGAPSLPGWNAIILGVYHNGSPFATSFNFDYDQVIFSKATIPAPTV